MSKVVKFKAKINWSTWLILVILWNFGFPNATPLQDVLVAVFLSILFIIIHCDFIKRLAKLKLKK